MLREIKQDLQICGPFIIKDGKILFRNRYTLFGDDPDDTTYEPLIVCKSVMGNYGEILSADEIATFICNLLNGPTNE